MKKNIVSSILAILLIIQGFSTIVPINANAAGTGLRLQTYMGNISATTNMLYPNFNICNDSTAPINMANIKIRYYFTKDSSATQKFVCDSSVNAGTVVTGVNGSFFNMSGTNADTYLEITFPQGLILKEKSSLELKTRIYKLDWSNYNQLNDYSFNPTTNNFTDWNKVTIYNSGILLSGLEPSNGITNTPTSTITPTPTPTPKRFLVVVSNTIINYCRVEINQYLNDLTSEGWSPKLITVNNLVDDTATYEKIDASQLKSLIKSYSVVGYTGFVLIGSNPAIPDVKYLYGTETIPTDLYYADINGSWTDTNGDGIFEDNGSTYTPEMIYGRISAGGICNFDAATEGKKIAGYLTKIHDYRASGKQRVFDSKAFVYFDDTWVGWRSINVQIVRNLEKELHYIENRGSTDMEKLINTLTEGSRFGWMTVHSGGTSWGIASWPNGPESPIETESPDIELINKSTIKTNYLHLNSCFASDFTKQNLGAAFLFNQIDSYKDKKESYLYNVTGETYPYFFNLDTAYFEDLKSNCIGVAFRNMVARYAADGNCQNTKAILLGDPTLTYNFSTPKNKAPRITNDFSQVDAFVNKPFKLSLNTEDPENDAVTVSVSGLPPEATYNQSTKTINWIPTALQAGKSYNITVTAYNQDATGNPINKYVEDFKIFVSRMVNLTDIELSNSGFESVDANKKPLNWELIGSNNSGLYCDSTTKYSGSYSAKITDPTASYQRTITVEPNTYYLLSGFIKTSGCPNNEVSSGGARLMLSNGNNTLYSKGVNGTQDWTPEYIRYYSGNNTSIDIRCALNTDKKPGTAWFDNIKLEKDLNMGFELTTPIFNITEFPRWNFYCQNTASDSFSLAVRNENDKHSGLYSIKIASAQDLNYSSLTSKDIPVKPNTNYRVRAWFKTIGSISQGDGAFINVQYGTKSAKVSKTFNTSGVWELKEVLFNSENNSKINISCGIGSPTNFSTGILLVDDISVEIQ